jgi:hypothetical protein
MADRGECKRHLSISVSKLVLLLLWASFAVLYKVSSLGFRGVDKVFGRQLEVCFPPEDDRGEECAIALAPVDALKSSWAAEAVCCKSKPCVVGGDMSSCRSCEMMSPSAMVPTGFTGVGRNFMLFAEVIALEFIQVRLNVVDK